MSNFFEELKKRNVYKVATAYAVTSWLVIQVVNTVGPNLSWPDSLAPLVTKILLIGFPVALVLTWIYEFTPKGLKRTGKVQQDTSDNRKAGRRLNRLIITSLTLVICVLLADRLFSENTSINEKEKASIAVLPFDFQGIDGSLSFMSEALSGAISDRLGGVTLMMVTAKNSSSQFNYKDNSAKEIGKNLGVNYLIEGDLEFENNLVRLSTRLVNTSFGYVRKEWQYEEEMDSFMALEEDVAMDVVNELNIEILPEDSEQLRKRVSKNSEAYKLYLQALNFGKQRTDDSLEKAINLILEALKKEPYFAKAHAELVILYFNRHVYGEMQKNVAYENMKFHYTRAKDIDPDIAEVYYAEARVAAVIENDTSKAINSLRRAVELNPSYGDAHYALSRRLMRIDRDKAIESRLKAYELDPYNDFLSAMAAGTYKYSLNNEEKAFEILDKILAKTPGANWCSRQKSLFLSDSPYGEIGKSFIILHKALQKDPNDAVHLEWASGYAQMLDLIPIAQRYINLREIKFPNTATTFYRRFELNLLKKNYLENIDLITVWNSEKGLDPKDHTLYLANTYYYMGKPSKAKSILDVAYPKLSYLIDNISPSDTIPYEEFKLEIDTYIELHRALGNNIVADVLAEKTCEYAYLEIEKNSWKNTSIGLKTEMDCHYNKGDVNALVETLDQMWFVNKERDHGFQLFTDIQSGYFRPFEKDRVFIEFSKKVTRETHRMRAEVITYLKEEGDWDPSWDKELDLE